MLFQPKVSSLPPGIDLSGQTAVITGASAGLGLETARQLLQLHCSTVVLAVRNVAKGKACAEKLLKDPSIKVNKPTIKVLELDVDRNASIKAFTKTLQQETPLVHYLILNAGIARLKMERSPTGHEQSLQVNYLSNVLLLADLLPWLNASSKETGSPTRVTWVGSRTHISMQGFEKLPPLSRAKSVLEYMDSEALFNSFSRYGDSKLLCAMFFYSLAPRLDCKKIILNMVCPGQINTDMSDFLPWYLRVVVNLQKAMRARPVEVGGWCIVNAAVVAGAEAHGKFLGDKEILEASKYIRSPAGKEVQQHLWDETMEEMRKLTTLPVEFS
ncbi:Short-chain dehydrogenase/reductase SDR [Penicillium capsulatum]|uniref:Short-chain dehydrogenase/reductase SDR n=1 Tax=Penicillium capsulatum TaxID=69766 RepID=A0A9W9HRK3_9EURO|nr:Short-chain dehydrogenase/reductase SDR [Penicillium capsulatum]KAJ6106324.1 Short-chain dehydrogenase/reductase SDR [Penicillium capsulatum]